MSSGSTTRGENRPGGSINLTLTWQQVGSEVNVSIDQANFADQGSHLNVGYNWRMELVREVTSAAVEVIGERTGFVAEPSSSHRTFTNIGQQGSNIFVRVFFWRGTFLTGGDIYEEDFVDSGQMDPNNPDFTISSDRWVS